MGIGGAGISSYANNVGGSAPAAEAYSAPAAATASTAAFISTPLSGGGIGSYLDTVPQNQAVGGPGITSYLDTVPQNPSIGGAGISSYANNVGGSAAAAKAYSAPAAAAPSTATATFTSTPLSGGGITSYLDSVPQNSAVCGAG